MSGPAAGAERANNLDKTVKVRTNKTTETDRTDLSEGH